MGAGPRVKKVGFLSVKASRNTIRLFFEEEEAGYVCTTVLELHAARVAVQRSCECRVATRVAARLFTLWACGSGGNAKRPRQQASCHPGPRCWMHATAWLACPRSSAALEQTSVLLLLQVYAITMYVDAGEGQDRGPSAPGTPLRSWPHPPCHSHPASPMCAFSAAVAADSAGAAAGQGRTPHEILLGGTFDKAMQASGAGAACGSCRRARWCRHVTPVACQGVLVPGRACAA